LANGGGDATYPINPNPIKQTVIIYFKYLIQNFKIKLIKIVGMICSSMNSIKITLFILFSILFFHRGIEANKLQFASKTGMKWII
jgi:hypothetical protein